MEKKFDYFVCGDFEVCGRIESCLISVISNGNKETAKKELAQIIANPPADCLGNIHLEKEEKEGCWWNMGGLD